MNLVAHHDRRAMVRYRLTDAPQRSPLVLGAPGETAADVVAGLQRRYGDRLIETRRHHPGGAA